MTVILMAAKRPEDLLSRSPVVTAVTQKQVLRSLREHQDDYRDSNLEKKDR